MKTRIVSCLLILVLLLSLAPQLSVFAADDNSCGKNLTWSFEKATYTLTISGSGDMDDFAYLEAPWAEYRDLITEVQLPAGLTRIGNHAFLRFTALKSIVIPDSVKVIGWLAFADCSALSQVNFPKGVTVGSSAFADCALTELTLTGDMTLEDYAFSGNEALTSLTISDGVTAIPDGVFNSCSGLTSLTIPDSVTTLGGNAFGRCTALKTAALGKGVAEIGHNAFGYCESLESITVDPQNKSFVSDGGVLLTKDKSRLIRCPISKAGTYEVPASVRYLDEAAFEACSKLTAVTLPDGLTELPSFAFYNCSGLSEIKIPSTVSSVGWDAFYGCTGITEVLIPENVSYIGSWAFHGCTALKSLKILNKNCEIPGTSEDLGVPRTTTIYGHRGSTAQTYAQEYGYTFDVLSEEDYPCINGHSYGDWAQTAAPTCTVAGTQIRRCQKCDAVETQTIAALGHDWDDGVVTVAPTDTAPGVMTYTCKRCGETRTKRISGGSAAADIDFTDPADADKFEIKNKSTAAIAEGVGLALTCTRPAFEDCKEQNSGDQATTPEDVIVVQVSGDWTATLEVVFDTNGASNGYYQFFGFYAMEGDDYQNLAGIRGGDGAMQNFERHSGTITHQDEDGVNSTPGFASSGSTYWLRIEKDGDSYVCFRSSDGESFTEMFSYKDSGIEADNLVIDAYTGMTTGYKFTLKALTFEGGELPPEVDKTALQQAIRDYEFISTTIYTPDSIGALQAAVRAGKLVNQNENATQAEVDAAAQAILDAYAALELQPDEPPFEFDDVKDTNKFYYAPVYWAFNHQPQVTNGATDTTFNPDGACTRGHVVTFLWRAAGEPAPNTTTSPFTDLKESAFYYRAVLWAVENGITTGASKTTFAPGKPCTRGQIVTFLWRFRNSPEPKSTENPFGDVTESAFYYKAVLWAVENNVTSGTGKGKFSPDATCTRGQVVTFLCRAAAEN